MTWPTMWGADSLNYGGCVRPRRAPAASTARAARTGMASAHESPTAANSMRRCSGGEVSMDARDDSRY